MTAKKVTLDLGTTKVELPVYEATMGLPVVDMKTLGKYGYWSYDPAFMATAACESKITYIDGDKGELFYRGYPIEELAEKSNHLEGAYLLLNGELPTKEELKAFETEITKKANLSDDFIKLFKGFDKNAHPMAVLTSLVGALSAYYPDAFDFKNDQKRSDVINTLIAKVPTVVAYIYRHSQGLDFVAPKSDLSYSANFINMMFGSNDGSYKVDPRLAKAMDRIFLLHADHEQNASTSTVRMAGSSGTHPFAAVTAGVACLWGPAHGGANEAVLKMLEEIKDPARVEEYMAGVKEQKYRLMGFGHRVYKNYDPRANIMRATCHEVLEILGKHDDPLFKLAMGLEKVALSDEYFVNRKLYPNVDFYSGIILKALGIPVAMFTTIFALARTVGWLSQWQEMIIESDLKISRPRQLYTGYTRRSYSK